MQTPAQPRRRVARRQFGFQEGGLLLVIVILGAFLAVFGGKVKAPMFKTNPQGERERVFIEHENGEREPAFEEKNMFLNSQSLIQLAKDTSFIAIMAVGATIVIICGGIDLSVGSIYALASVSGAIVFHAWGPEGAHSGAPYGAKLTYGIGACIGTALLCGLLNGGMIVTLKVHPFIITLGTMAIFRGVAFVVTNGLSIGDFPAEFRDLVLTKIGPDLTIIPLIVILVVTCAGGIFLSLMAAGRRVYAVGGNELASRYSGIQVSRVKLGVFLISGLTAGISALLAAGYYGAASSADGTGYELNVIAAAVVGGASLSGGKGTALGALLGALIIQMINTGIVILHLPQNYSQIIIGAVVILAVVFDQVNNWLAKRRLAARAGSN